MPLLTLMVPTPAQQTIPNQWFDSGVNVAVEIAFGCGPLDRVKLWQDVTPWVSAVQTNAGRSEELDRFQPGSAQITFRFDEREFDPEYPDGPWFGSILPNVPVRVRAQYEVDGVPTDHFLFQGTVDEWPQDYSFGQAGVTVPCTDVFGVLSRITVESAFAVEVMADIAGDSSPTAWYRFSEPTGTTAMVDQFGNNGTYTGAPTLEVAGLTAGGGNTAVTFDTNKYGRVTPGTVIANTTFAVEFLWAGNSIPDPGYVMYADDTVTGNSLVDVHLSTSGYANALTLQVFDDGGINVFQLFSVAGITDGEPHHFVVGLDSARSPFCYLDGALVTTYKTTAAYGGAGGVAQFTNPIDDARIGCYYTGSSPIGTLDELIIWDGVNPSAARIAAHATAALTGWSGNTTAEQADVILDAVGWDAQDRVIGTGSTIVGAEGPTGSVYEYLMRLQETEGGQCYADGRGRIVFRGRTNLTGDTRTTTSQAVFGDR